MNRFDERFPNLQVVTDLQSEQSYPPDYFRQEISSDSYRGEWRGKLAEKMNLCGAVATEQFERLCDGLDPHTGEELIRRQPVKKYIGKGGREITTMGHRAGWDATFSAPKSVSLAATVGGDERIRIAHRESVRTALSELERYAEARLGGEKLSKRTGKLVSALFEHDLARPDSITGYAAPQLHTHAVTFNLTETADGRIKPIQPYELFKSQNYATAVYRIELADRLQKLGYEIEIDPKTFAPEIKGFSSEYLKESSPRSREINKEAEIVRDKFGLEPENDAGIRQIAAWQKRESKGFDPGEMKSRALELEVKYDFEAQRIVQQASMSKGYQLDILTQKQAAEKIIDSVQNDLSPASASLPDARRILTEALRRGIGFTAFDDVRDAYNSRIKSCEHSNLIENDFHKDEKSISDDRKIKTDEKEYSLSSTNKAEESISMDELENSIRQASLAEKEAASLEFLIAL